MATESVGVEVPADSKPAEDGSGAKPRKPRGPKKGAVSPDKPRRILTAKAPATELAPADGESKRKREAPKARAKIRVVTIEAEGTGEELATLARKMTESI